MKIVDADLLTDSANRKLAVPLTEDIESIQQCVQEATVHRHGVAAHMTRPHDLLLLQALGPQAQAIALPIQDSDAIPESNDIQHTDLTSSSLDIDGTRCTVSGQFCFDVSAAAAMKSFTSR